MTSDDAQDTGAESLKRLAPLVPDPARVARVRLRCRTQLVASRRRRGRTALITGFAWSVLAPALVGGFCVFYVAVLMATTLRLQGIFH